MNARNLLKKTTKELKSIPVSEPDTSAEFLLRYILKKSRSEFYSELDTQLTHKEIKEFEKLIDRRKKHEPVYQIVGKVEFWGLDFYINGDVLVPRPETEFLVKEVLKEVKDRKKGDLSILDVGTGAGPIIIALASEFKEGNFYASDVSKEALIIAKKNAKANNVGETIEFRVGELLNPWKGKKFDIITANLPYIPHEDLPGLTVEIYHYEPRVALDGGNGGLVLYEEFVNELPNYLDEKGMAFCEIGKDQGKLFTKIVQKYMPNTKCTILQDLAGFDRIAVIKRGVK
jgi:release factor glutamine methyltransferase